MGNCLKLQRATASWVDDDEWVVEDDGGKAVEKMERVEVKIRVTKRQVQELLEKAGRDSKGRRTAENVLAELINSGTLCFQHELRCHWRPSLQSITEGEEA